MQIQVSQIEAFTLAGLSMKMTLQNFQPETLFKKFIPLIPSIENRISQSIFDIHMWPQEILTVGITPYLEFTKWAAIMVNKGTNVIDPLSIITLPGGLYASFEHVGSSQNIKETMNHFFNHWLPGSDYILDNRPHIYEMDDRYKGPHNDNSIEIIRIPVEFRN